jgi:hypothetical protein
MKTPSRLVLLTSLGLVACAPQPEPGRAESALTNAYKDTDDPDADIVVRIVGGNLCTGTLISSDHVLTAKHCITGSDSSIDSKPPAKFPLQIQIGNDTKNMHVLVSVTSPSQVTPFGNWDPINYQEAGTDLAILKLDAPVTNFVNVPHPTLTSPTLGDDKTGGQYGYGWGMAGWAALDAPEFRQALIFNTITLHHYTGFPDNLGQFWDYSQHLTQVNPGDSGGPLFYLRNGTQRDIMGVLDGTRYPQLTDCGTGACAIWTDVTRGAPKQFIVDQMTRQDRGLVPGIAARGPNFWAQHPNYHWLGDVDYYGACQPSSDFDCDHWLDVHDNCPTVPNIDQMDSDDDRRGDVCNDWADLGGWLQGVDNPQQPINGSYQVFMDPARNNEQHLIAIGWENGTWEKLIDGMAANNFGAPDVGPLWSSLNPMGWVTRIAATPHASPSYQANELFAVGVGSGVYHRYEMFTYPWDNWAQVYDTFTATEIASVRRDNGTAAVIAIDASDGSVASYDPLAFSGGFNYFYNWKYLPDLPTRAVSLSATNIGGRVHVAVVGADGNVYHTSDQSSSSPFMYWNGWEKLGRGATWMIPIPNQVVAASTPVGSLGGARISVFTVEGGAIYRNTLQASVTGPAWTGWQEVAPVFSRTQQIAVANNGMNFGPGVGRLELFSVDANHDVWDYWQESESQADTWPFAGPVRRGANRSQIGVSNDPDGRIEIWALDTRNHHLMRDFQVYKPGFSWYY